LAGELDDVPESCFYNKGGIDDVYAAFDEVKKKEAVVA